jgi:hypothetical protein
MVVHLCLCFIAISIFVAGVKNVECQAHTRNKCGKNSAMIFYGNFMFTNTGVELFTVFECVYCYNTIT